MNSAAPLAVVTGGGSGLGLAIARELAQRGYRLALLGRRVESLRAAAASLVGPCQTYACDVRRPKSLSAAVGELGTRQGSASVVVLAAGAARVGPLESLSEADLTEVLDTNLAGAIRTVQAFLPALRSTQGTLVPLLSVAARRGFRDWSVYCASKWGLAGFVLALREELAGSGVRVLEVFPGAVDTPIWEGIPGEWNRASMMRPEEVARAVVSALEPSGSVTVEQLHLSPPGGAL